MKRIILFITLAAGSVYILHGNYSSKASNKASVRPQTDSVQVEQPIRVIFYQDVSGSTALNGVELVSAAVFSPYYADIHRDIDLYFGCIADVSAKKLIHLPLPKATFVKPALPGLRGMSITESNKYKKDYANDLRQYKSDSAAFYTARNKSIEAFKQQVDALLNRYRDHLSGETDLATAVKVADKVFNMPAMNNARNFLLLNSDGQDSYHATIGKMMNPATVILVNASAIKSTSVDSILTKTCEDPEQAILFTLKI